MPKTGRSLIGTVAGFKSEWWPVFDRNGGRLHVGICNSGRKYGITLMLMYQSVGQLERHFGKDGATSWIEGCAFTSYAAIKALDTARNVSAQCGDMTVEVQGRTRDTGWSKSNSGGRRSETVSFQRRPLIMPHEITQSMRKDEQIIIVQGRSPIRCGRAIYFRRKEMDEAAKVNRFFKL